MCQSDPKSMLWDLLDVHAHSRMSAGDSMPKNATSATSSGGSESIKRRVPAPLVSLTGKKMTDLLSRATKCGYAVLHIEAPDGSIVTMCAPSDEIGRFEAAIAAAIGRPKPKRSKVKSPEPKRRKNPRPRETFKWDEADAVWTVMAHGFGAPRSVLEKRLNDGLLDAAIDSGDLVVDGEDENGSPWVRLPNAAELEKEIFDKLLEMADNKTLYRSNAGECVRRMHSDYYTKEFFAVVMDASIDPEDGVFDEVVVIKSGVSYPTYVPRAGPSDS